MLECWWGEAPESPETARDVNRVSGFSARDTDSCAEPGPASATVLGLNPARTWSALDAARQLFSVASNRGPENEFSLRVVSGLSGASPYQCSPLATMDARGDLGDL
jgi:hypothetical protein